MMNSDQLLEEIRELRSDIKDLKKEFYLFKGKAFGFITLLSFIFSLVVDIIKKKL